MSGFKEYADYDGLGLAELVRARQVAPEEVLEAAIGRIEALNPTLNAVVTRVYDEARLAAAAPRPGRAVRGRAVPAQGPGRRPGRRAAVRRLALLQACGRAGRRRDRGAPQARRADDPRPHQHAGVRAQRHDRAGGVRADPQPLRPRAHARRLERRLGGGGRRAHGADRACQRRRRLDPHPGVLLRAVRAQADAQPQHLRALCRRGPGGLLGRARGLAQRARQRRGARCDRRPRASATPTSPRRHPGPSSRRSAPRRAGCGSRSPPPRSTACRCIPTASPPPPPPRRCASSSATRSRRPRPRSTSRGSTTTTTACSRSTPRPTSRSGPARSAASRRRTGSSG